MKLGQIVFIVMVAVVVTISGCICCCGFDSAFSKFKKSVTDIDFPDKVAIGGKTYEKAFTHEHLTPGEAKASIYAFARKLGYEPTDLGGTEENLFTIAGIQEDRSFKYTGPGPNDIFGGSVAKTGAPSTANAGYTAIKQAALAAMSAANDPEVNDGSVQNIVHDGDAAIGDGGDTGHAIVDGKMCYVTVSRYSNMYITSYSYESAEKASQVAEWVIGQIDKAA